MTQARENVQAVPEVLHAFNVKTHPLPQAVLTRPVVCGTGYCL